jgi:hypothetical protein
VLVGTAPDQKRFTVHHDIATKRSGFYRAARSERWTPETKPTDLSEHDPETFTTYLHCIYGNAMPEHVHPPIIADERVLDFMQLSADARLRADRQFEHSINLYVLADSLMDPLTANMAIAEIRRIGKVADEFSQTPGANVIARAFRSTREDDGLRNLLVDFYIYNPFAQHNCDFPKAFLLLLSQRFQNAKHGNNVSFDEEHLEELQGDSPWTIADYYQKLEQSP